jgi:hypothetical protein
VPLQNRVNLGELLADGTVSSNTPVKAAATDKSDRERWVGLFFYRPRLHFLLLAEAATPASSLEILLDCKRWAIVIQSPNIRETRVRRQRPWP